MTKQEQPKPDAMVAEQFAAPAKDLSDAVKQHFQSLSTWTELGPPLLFILAYLLSGYGIIINLLLFHACAILSFKGFTRFGYYKLSQKHPYLNILVSLVAFLWLPAFILGLFSIVIAAVVLGYAAVAYSCFFSYEEGRTGQLLKLDAINSVTIAGLLLIGAAVMPSGL